MLGLDLGRFSSDRRGLCARGLEHRGVQAMLCAGLSLSVPDVVVGPALGVLRTFARCLTFATTIGRLNK